MSATIKVEIKQDNIKEILKELGERSEKALAAIGMECEGYAKAECPVDTGRLRNSIAWATTHDHGNTDSAMQDGDDTPKATPKEQAVYIGSNVEYAERIEFQDMAHKVGRAHFLRDAATTHSEHYKSILKAALDT